VPWLAGIVGLLVGEAEDRTLGRESGCAMLDEAPITEEFEMPQREPPQRGDFITSDSPGAVAKPHADRREHIFKGKFMRIDSTGPRATLGREFDLAAFNQKHAAIIAEMARRLEGLCTQLDSVKARVKK
jgi:hypothetical protein